MGKNTKYVKVVAKQIKAAGKPLSRQEIKALNPEKTEHSIKNVVTRGVKKGILKRVGHNLYDSSDTELPVGSAKERITQVLMNIEGPITLAEATEAANVSEATFVTLVKDFIEDGIVVRLTPGVYDLRDRSGTSSSGQEDITKEESTHVEQYLE